MVSEPGLARGKPRVMTPGFKPPGRKAYNSGVTAGTEWCKTNPQECGILLEACMADPTFGETEPNDNIVSADPLVLDTKFWGQSYGPLDQDWFYTITDKANQTLTINFSIPGGTPAGWTISIRDAAGNIFTEFDTSAVGTVTTADGAITYRATLGLVGTYYIVLKTTGGTPQYEPYNLAVILQDSPLETPNFVVGFHDVEVEPDNVPGKANQLASGVAMYGLINLTFNNNLVVPDTGGNGFEYSQGYDVDWYVYSSPGNEIINLSICNREACTLGNWLFEVYDEASAIQAALFDRVRCPSRRLQLQHGGA